MDNHENPQDALLNKIAISLGPGIGSITAKSLIAYCGSARPHTVEPVVTLKMQNLKNILNPKFSISKLIIFV